MFRDMSNISDILLYNTSNGIEVDWITRQIGLLYLMLVRQQNLLILFDIIPDVR